MASSVVDVGNGLILDEQCIQGIWAVEESLGYRFGDKRLLLTALTHRSFCNENNTGTGDFDELEWLGDSVLQLAVSSWLFRTAQGSRRSSGNLSLTRVRFVDAGACESFAKKLKLHPFLRIGHGQPVAGTKILADCFEAVLGAVYVDAGDCTDLAEIHRILSRVIPSYEFERRPHPTRPQSLHSQPAPQHPPSRHPISSGHFPLPSPPPHAVAQEQRKVRGEEPRKIMNLAHRVIQIAKNSNGEEAGVRGTEHQGASAHLPSNGVQPDRHEVLRELDGRLRDFQQIILRGGALSYSTAACAEAFGEEVAWFYARTATTPRQCVLLDSVLAEESMLKKEFSEAPPGAELVVMEVVIVPAELRLQCFTVVEYLLVNILRQDVPSHQQAVRLFKSTPHGIETLKLLEIIINESASSLLFTTRQRSVISARLAGESAELSGGSAAQVTHAAGGQFPPNFAAPPGHMHRPGEGSGRKQSSSQPHPDMGMRNGGRRGGSRGRGRGRGRWRGR